jgi:hypothetical protein
LINSWVAFCKARLVMRQYIIYTYTCKILKKYCSNIILYFSLYFRGSLFVYEGYIATSYVTIVDVIYIYIYIYLFIFDIFMYEMGFSEEVLKHECPDYLKDVKDEEVYIYIYIYDVNYCNITCCDVTFIENLFSIIYTMCCKSSN